MARADPTRSFDVAVRHLFRHLGDARALRCNPLVAGFFEPESRSSAAGDAETLVAIRSLIVEAAGLPMAANGKPFPRSQVQRHGEIVSGLCAGQTAATIAGRLGISLPQFYRDRRTVCVQIGRSLQARRDRNVVRAGLFDPLQLALRRASALVDHGMPATAAADLERITSEVSSDAAKAAALLTLSNALLEMDDIHGAGIAATDAGRRLARSNGNDEPIPGLRQFAGLTDFRITLIGGRFGAAAHSLSRLAREVPGSSRAGEVEIAILIRKCQFNLFYGTVREARAAIDLAATLARTRPYVLPEDSVALAAWSVYAYEHGMPAGEALVRFREVLQLAVSTGSAEGALAATVGMARACIILGDETAAIAYAQRALQIARRMEGPPSLFFAASSTGPMLLRTHYWPVIEPIVSEIDGVPRRTSPQWAMIKYCHGTVLARRRRYADAVARLTLAESAAAGLRNDRFHAEVQRELALALHGLGRKREAVDCIRSAVTTARAASTADELRITDAAAARILGTDGFEGASGEAVVGRATSSSR